MSASSNDYTLEVVLGDMPHGWVCAAIGKGKPYMAPPPTVEEIRRLKRVEQAWNELAKRAPGLGRTLDIMAGLEKELQF